MHSNTNMPGIGSLIHEIHVKIIEIWGKKPTFCPPSIRVNIDLAASCPFVATVTHDIHIVWPSISEINIDQ